MHRSLLSWRGNLWLAGADVQIFSCRPSPEEAQLWSEAFDELLASKCKLTSWIWSVSSIRRVWKGCVHTARAACPRRVWLYNPCNMGPIFLLYFQWLTREMHGFFTIGGESGEIAPVFNGSCCLLRLSQLFHCKQCFQEASFPKNLCLPYKLC